MPTFKLQFPADEIEALAARFGYEDDSRLLASGTAARARGHYTRQEFIEVCAWKTARSRSKVASNTLGACRELARRFGVTIRTLDKALWQHSKESSATPTS
jgi:hypothetical protein